MTAIRTWRELKVWQKAHKLVLLTYKLTARFPSEEKYGLTSQMRRAAVSIASNIVEGFKRRTVRDSLNFYNTADASLEELKYQYLLACDLSYLSKENRDSANQVMDEVGMMLYAWAKSQKENVASA